MTYTEHFSVKIGFDDPVEVMPTPFIPAFKNTLQ
jgi:hypothetical protein